MNIDQILCRTFIEVPIFTKRWDEIGLDDSELLELQLLILKNPEVGPLIQGTGGLRKVRFPLNNRGKSRSVRVCYYDIEEYGVTFLLTAYTKNEQDNLTDEQKKILKVLVKQLKKEVSFNSKGE